MFAIQQTAQFDGLNGDLKKLIRLLQQSQSPFGEEFKTQNLIIATFSHETKEHITSEHERTRNVIIEAFRKSHPPKKVFPKIKPRASSEDSDVEEYGGVIEDTILASLRFPSMNDRYDGIEEAFQETFDWIFSKPNPTTQPWDDFSKWLSEGDGIYWINGKAGSGKSTLMRYVYEDPRTMRLLETWAGSPQNLVTVGFFFWKSGVPDQASQLGLLRSLVYALLSKRRKPIQQLFPDEWQILARRAKVNPSHWHLQQQEQTWSMRQLKNCLISLLASDLLDCQVCIFVDGLDEYNGDLADAIQLFKRIASPKVKICVSSRPWIEFHEGFKFVPSLRLQDLTFDDIRLYVDGVFGRDDRMIALAEGAPKEASHFVNEIVAKANGVFLWVKLVVTSILNGLTNGDRMSELQQRLDELPSDLKRLYVHMLAAIRSRYFVEGAQIFTLMDFMHNFKFLPKIKTPQKQLCALTLSFALEEDDNSVVKHPTGLTTASKVIQRVERIDRRLKVCCAGLLEVSVPKNRELPPVVLPEFGNKPINYIHRTAMDFLHSPAVWQQIGDAVTAAGCNNNRTLLRSFVLRLKTCHMPLVGGYGFEEYLATPISLLSYIDKEGPMSNATVELFDELGRALLRLQPDSASYGFTGTRNKWHRVEDFTAMALEFSLFNYLTAKFPPNIEMLQYCAGQSYLYHALQRQQLRPVQLVELEKQIEFLLPRSSQPDIDDSCRYLQQYITDQVNKAANPGDTARRPSPVVQWHPILKQFQSYGFDANAYIEKHRIDWEQKFPHEEPAQDIQVSTDNLDSWADNITPEESWPDGEAPADFGANANTPADSWADANTPGNSLARPSGISGIPMATNLSSHQSSTTTQYLRNNQVRESALAKPAEMPAPQTSKKPRFSARKWWDRTKKST